VDAWRAREDKDRQRYSTARFQLAAGSGGSLDGGFQASFRLPPGPGVTMMQTTQPRYRHQLRIYARPLLHDAPRSACPSPPSREGDQRLASRVGSICSRSVINAASRPWRLQTPPSARRTRRPCESSSPSKVSAARCRPSRTVSAEVQSSRWLARKGPPNELWSSEWIRPLGHSPETSRSCDAVQRKRRTSLLGVYDLLGQGVDCFWGLVRRGFPTDNSYRDCR
jgi:hypothetical protein